MKRVLTGDMLGNGTSTWPARRARAVIVGTNAAARRRLRILTEVAPGIDVVAEAADRAQAVQKVLEHHPDLLLLDAVTPVMEELSGIPQLTQLAEVAVLTWGDEDGRGPVGDAAGQAGPGEALQAALGLAGRPSPGETPGPSAATGPRDGNDDSGLIASRDLTRREREVMELITAGLSNRQIADVLVVSQKTVKNHIGRIYQCIGVHERSQAVRRWKELPAPRTDSYPPARTPGHM